MHSYIKYKYKYLVKYHVTTDMSFGISTKKNIKLFNDL